jgi:hypothetical protein
MNTIKRVIFNPWFIALSEAAAWAIIVVCLFLGTAAK